MGIKFKFRSSVESLVQQCRTGSRVQDTSSVSENMRVREKFGIKIRHRNAG